MNRNKKERTERIYVRVSPQEKKRIESIAKACKLSTAEYIRKRAIGYNPTTIPSEIFYDFYSQLCDLSNKLSEDISHTAEEVLLELIYEIHDTLVKPVKQNRGEIIDEVLNSWQPQDSGP